MADGRSNLLVLSDLHLGGALRPPIRFRQLRTVARLDRELCRFLDHHRERPLKDEEGRRSSWTLVFNGDTIDFLHMDLRPGDGQPDAPDEEEQVFGLAFAEKRSRWKMGQIAHYHRRAFQALARFVDAGNRVVFVVGNHDADLCFRVVREELVAQVARHAADPAGVAARVSFTPWFYYEEGRAYLEHGHRFDPYATFPDPLEPSGDGQRLDPNFGHWALRYFCNSVRSFPIHDLDTWGPRDYVRWALARSPRAVLGAFGRALGFVWQYIRDTSPHRSAARAEARARRRARLERFARLYRMPLARIRALDSLGLPHLGASLLRLCQGLYLDRIALAALGVLATIWAFSAIDGGWSVVLAAAALLTTAAVWIGLARLRPDPDCHPVLDRMALRIGRLTGARVVVFGHTHRPILRRFGRTHWLNPGSWEHLPRSRGHAADEPCNCTSRFAVITGRAERTRATLFRWCRARGPVTARD